MGRQIVICMDGTWNDPTERTNVYKLFSLLPGDETEVRDAQGIRSHLSKRTPDVEAIYLEGVGAKGRQQGPLGGGLGIGLHDRVMDAFVLASRLYRTGDKFWIFGFSRGAWSARSLAGLIASGGMLERPDAQDANTRAEALWLDCKHGRDENPGDAYWEQTDQTPIRLVGVWDTVGALGIPFFNGIKVFDKAERLLFDFADLDLSPRAQSGLQALSVDETRFDFSPTLWKARTGVEQIWFAGVHADVGGGYHHTGLSDVALGWMVERINALDAGLRLDTANLTIYRPDPLQDRHDEARKAIWHARPRRPRQIAPDAPLHTSVDMRLAGRMDYRPDALSSHSGCGGYFNPPPNVSERLLPQADVPPTRRLEVGEQTECTAFAQNWWNSTGVEVAEGERFLIAATGKWTDKNTEKDAAGYESGNNLLLRATERTRRVREAPWFALICARHSDPTLELKNPTSGNFLTGGAESVTKQVEKIDDASQLLTIGLENTFVATGPGYLYLFANDARFAYSNNSGYLDVTIARSQ